MRNIIRKILKEEFNDFDWVDNIVPSNELKTKASELEGKGYI